MTSLKKVAILFRDHRLDQIHNTLRFGYHAFRRFPTERLPYDPLWLTLFVTSSCNLRCRFCHIWGLDARRKRPSFQEMNLDSLQQILDRFPRTIAVEFTGGEPLANPHLFEMARLVQERRIKAHLFTNATLLPDKLDAFLETPFEFVNISLYGPDAETFVKVTRSSMSTFDDMVKAVAELCRRRRPGGFPRTIRASFICSKDNWELVPDLIRLCEKLGVDQVKLKNLRFHETTGLPDSLCLNAEDQEVQAFLAGLRRQRFSMPVFLPRVPRHDDRRKCDHPFKSVSIDGDGFIGLCGVMADKRCWGNFFEQPDFWNGPAMARARRNQMNPASPVSSICRYCEERIPERQKAGE